MTWVSAVVDGTVAVLSVIVSISVFITAAGVLLKVFGKLDKLILWMHKVKDLVNTVPEHLNRQDAQIKEIKDTIKDELRPNSGESVKNLTIQNNNKLIELSNRLDVHFEQATHRDESIKDLTHRVRRIEERRQHSDDS